MTFVNTQVIEEFRHAERYHRRTSISVKGKLVRVDCFSLAGFADEVASNHLGFGGLLNFGSPVD